MCDYALMDVVRRGAGRVLTPMLVGVVGLRWVGRLARISGGMQCTGVESMWRSWAALKLWIHKKMRCTINQRVWIINLRVIKSLQWVFAGHLMYSYIYIYPALSPPAFFSSHTLLTNALRSGALAAIIASAI